MSTGHLKSGNPIKGPIAKIREEFQMSTGHLKWGPEKAIAF